MAGKPKEGPTPLCSIPWCRDPTGGAVCDTSAAPTRCSLAKFGREAVACKRCFEVVRDRYRKGTRGEALWEVPRSRRHLVKPQAAPAPPPPKPPTPRSVDRVPWGGLDRKTTRQLRRAWEQSYRRAITVEEPER